MWTGTLSDRFGGMWGHTVLCLCSYMFKQVCSTCLNLYNPELQTLLMSWKSVKYTQRRTINSQKEQLPKSTNSGLCKNERRKRHHSKQVGCMSSGKLKNRNLISVRMCEMDSNYWLVLHNYFELFKVLMGFTKMLIPSASQRNSVLHVWQHTNTNRIKHYQIYFQ